MTSPHPLSKGERPELNLAKGFKELINFYPGNNHKKLNFIPAKMIAYCYGKKYAETVATIIPSKKGIKLSFYKGIDLPDPHHLPEGTEKQINSPENKTIT